MKRITLVLLCFIMVFGMFGCHSPKSENHLEIWTAPGTKKILKDISYDSLFENKKLEIGVFRNEYESAQIILTPEKNISEYNVEVFDLKTADGKHSFPKDDISVYHEKYMYVERIMDANVLTSTGYYPDALLPFENAVKCKENNIDAGCNQGVWITVHPSSADQTTGVYFGNIRVTADGTEYFVPVELTVYDYTLSDEVHSKSSFLINWDEVAYGEYTDRLYMQELYYETLLDYRISPNHLPGNSFSIFGEGDADRFVDYAVKYYGQYANYNIPYNRVSQLASTPVTNESGDLQYENGELQTSSRYINTTDLELMRYTLRRMFAEAVKNEMDLFRYAQTYFVFFDEYDMTDSTDSANYTLLSTSRLYEKIATEKVIELARENGSYDSLTEQDRAVVDNLYKELVKPVNYEQVNAEYTRMMELHAKKDKDGVYRMFDPLEDADRVIVEKLKQSLQPFEKELVDSLANIVNKCVGPKLDIIAAKATFVSTIDTFDQSDAIAEYRESAEYWYQEDAELWTYTCVRPKPPYPSYHLEDELLSSRMLGWMMYNYNITGLLYWDVALYALAGGVGFIQDFYDTPLRFATCNGDGFLLYPGKEYGVKGPVTSIRLHSIRDGNEEYDLLYALERFYEKRATEKSVEYDGSGFDEILSLATGDLYRGTNCNYTEGYLEKFDSLRKTLATLLVAAKNSGVILEGYKVTGGTGVLTVSAPKDVEISANDKIAADGVTTENITTYRISIPLENENNTIHLSVAGENGFEIMLSLGGKRTEFSIDMIEKDDVEMTSGGTAEFAKQENENVLKFSFTATEETPYVDIDLTAFHISAGTSAIILSIYVEEALPLKIAGRAERGAFIEVWRKELQVGRNEIEIDALTFNLGTNGGLRTLRISLPEAKNGEVYTISLGSFILEG